MVYNLEDQIGSSTIRLNNYGGIIDKEEYYPFGDSSFRTFAKKRYRYVGKEKDLESGLYYYGARYYAAWTCRFISVNPLASDYVHLTPYNNAGNKPINSIDIDGLQGANEQESGGIVNPEPFLYEKIETPVEVTAKRIPTDQVSEKAKGSGWTRFWGGVKAVFGTIESAAGVALTSTGFLSPLGAILFIHGADVASSGFRQAITGEKTETLTYQGARKVSKAAGASDETATGIASGFDSGISLLSGFGGREVVKNAGTLPKVLVGESVAANTGVNAVEQVAVHGNSLKSLKPTWGYKLYSQNGTFLKNGITSKLVPESRYTKAFMSDKYMVPFKQFPNRLGAYKWEFQQNQILRGPLNLNMH